jgi:signal transduction histidine kinase
MIFIFLTLLIVAVLLWIVKRKEEQARWAVLILLSGSLESLAEGLEEAVFPVGDSRVFLAPAWIGVLQLIRIYGGFLYHIFSPYVILMFAIVESGWFDHKLKRSLRMLLFVPIIIMLILSLKRGIMVQTNVRLFMVWNILSLFITCVLLTGAYVKESNPAMKRRRLEIRLFIGPTLAILFMLGDIAKLFHSEIPMHHYLTAVACFLFALFMIIGFIYNGLGMRLHFVQRQLDLTMSTKASGISLVHHAVKEEMGKILMVAHQVDVLAEKHSQREIQRYTSFIRQSAEHLLTISIRMSRQFREIVLNEKQWPLVQIIEDSMTLVAPLSESKRIRIHAGYIPPLLLRCDLALVQEVLVNVWTNAIEAMKEEGALSIVVYRTNRGLIIESRDNGPGISKQHRRRILDPFFSTKKEFGHMGLGLIHSFQIMRKHNGFLKIDSIEGMGTTVTLLFPKKRVL